VVRPTGFKVRLPKLLRPKSFKVRLTLFVRQWFQLKAPKTGKAQWLESKAHIIREAVASE
jgi:hypothetical protein